MKIKCDRCAADATVHEVTLKSGEKVEHHLCESCARSAGIAINAAISLEKLVTTFVTQHAAAAGPRAVSNACEGCGLTFAEFRQKGLLGCPSCYASFEQQIGPLIERAHQGATHHCGKTPAKAEFSEAMRQRMTLLRQQLSEAVASEQYERAAVIRDELSRVTEPAPRATSENPPEKSPAKGAAKASRPKRDPAQGEEKAP
ncbi:MAG: UvrB/UvrC motif-containing protein [Planctomycetes bacterium]|nr:UvrB/UvrC motif-containing protein [Planctomycetota bacterium]